MHLTCHFCLSKLLYNTQVSFAVRYFLYGLNEACYMMWITSAYCQLVKIVLSD